MTEKLTKSGFEPVSIEVEANNQTCLVSIDDYKEVTFLSARFMYQRADGTMAHGRNGINIRIDGDEGMQAALTIIEAMQHALTITAQHTEGQNEDDDSSTT